MSASMIEVREAVGEELKGLTNLSDQERIAMDLVAPKAVKAAKKGAEKALNRGVPITPGATAELLWKILVRTLSAVVILAVLGVGWTVIDGNADTAPDVLVTIFTAALTGLIGLFVNPQS